jgi:hypothetical protein
MEITKKPGLKIGFIVLTVCGCVAALAQQPAIVATSVSGANLVLTGSNGQSGGTYYVLTSTYLPLPLSQWTPVAANLLGASGAGRIERATVSVGRHHILKPGQLLRRYQRL